MPLLRRGKRLLHQMPGSLPAIREVAMLANMKIATRLFLGFGLLVAIIAGLAGYSVYSARSERDAFLIALRLKEAESLDQRVQKRIFEGRVNIWAGLGTGDAARWEKV